MPSNSISLANSIHPRSLVVLERKFLLSFGRFGEVMRKGLRILWKFGKLSQDDAIMSVIKRIIYVLIRFNA